NGYFYLPGRIVHEAWVPAGSRAVIILEDGWKVDWLEGPPTAKDIGKGAPPRELGGIEGPLTPQIRLRRNILMRPVFVICARVSAAQAWTDRGHMLVAMVAYQEMRPDLRAKVNDILRHHPQYDLLKEGEPTPGPEQDLWVFLRAATWPDMVRSPHNPLHGEENH